MPGPEGAADEVVRIIDAHTHVVSKDKARYPLEPRSLSGTWYLDAPASAEDLAQDMRKSGVAHAILVQGVGAYTYDNRYAADAAAANPVLFTSACCIDVEATDATSTLDYWIRDRGMRGVRLFALAREGPSWLADDRTFAIWDRARELEAHVIVTILPHQLGELEVVLERFPETPISLDHCGFAIGDTEAYTELVALARFPNLHLKVTTHAFDEAVEQEGSARPLMARLVDSFGADRIMWGSDYCQIHDRSYAELVALARDAMRDLPLPDQIACLGATVQRLFRIQLPDAD